VVTVSNLVYVKRPVVPQPTYQTLKTTWSNVCSISYLAPSCAASFVLGRFGPDHLKVAIMQFKVIQGHRLWY